MSVDNRAEIVAAVRDLVDRGYGGKMRRLFDVFDTYGNGYLRDEQLYGVLLFCQVGTDRKTRLAATRAIMDELDTNRDGRISYDEFHKFFGGGT